MRTPKKSGGENKHPFAIRDVLALLIRCIKPFLAIAEFAAALILGGGEILLS